MVLPNQGSLVCARFGKQTDTKITFISCIVSASLAGDACSPSDVHIKIVSNQHTRHLSRISYFKIIQMAFFRSAVQRQHQQSNFVEEEAAATTVTARTTTLSQKPNCGSGRCGNGHGDDSAVAAIDTEATGSSGGSGKGLR